MHHQFKFRGKVILLSLLTAIQVRAGDPSDISQTTITRTSANGLSLQTKLSKNVYRTESYQDTENYYVDVPYQDTEEYTDYETQYSNDYVCNDVDDYERQCHNEQDCDGWSLKLIGLNVNSLVPMREREPGVGPAPYVPPSQPAPYNPPAPEPRPEPNPPPYVPPAPEPRPEPPPYVPPYHPPEPRPEPPPYVPPYHPPEPRPEPNPPPYVPPYTPPEPVCRYHQVCEDVPTTRQECDYEQVAHQVPVTRTRTITRYTHELRTREVTRTRQVYDHQYGLNVVVNFAADAALLAGEHESFKFDIAGSESSPDVTVTPVDAVLGYKVANKQIDHGQAVITLQTIPRFKAADLKETTIQNLLVAPATTGATFKFLDNGLFPRITSHFTLAVADAQTHAVLAQTEVRPITQRDQQGVLTFAIDQTKQYEVILTVHREAPVLVIDAGVVDFQIKQPLQEKVDIKALQDDSKITATMSGVGSAAKLNLVDKTENYSSVATKYVISLVRKSSAGKSVSMSEKLVTRSSLKLDTDGSYKIAVKDLGISDADVSKYLQSGSKVNAVVEVDRVTADGKKIQFWKDNAITVK